MAAGVAMRTVSVVSAIEREELRHRRAAVRALLEDPATATAEDLRQLADLDAAVRAYDDRRRTGELDSLVRMHGALAGLPALDSPTELIDAAPAALLAGTDLTRAMISRVREGVWEPQRFVAGEGVDPDARDFQDYIWGIEIPLERLRLETEMARLRRPALVLDAESDPRAFAHMVARARSTSYVAAPIVSDERVIGFVHADRFGTGVRCDESDLHALAAFADHFGALFERAVFIERLQAQRDRLRCALAEAAEALDELCEREFALARGGAPPSEQGPTRAVTSRVDLLLTRREREILDGLAAGLTNAQIARQLVLCEATVKSHLKRINRKLHTSSRSGAVARYLRLVGRGGSG
jgi:DNA-binding CsgD family transcriptional regulator/GAF domain-containing protein